MAPDQSARQPVTWRGGSPHRPGPQLPAFCRSRRPPVLVTLTSHFGLGVRLLLVLGLLLQLSTLLLLIAGPMPPQLTPAQSRMASSPTTGTTGAVSTSALRPPLLGR